MVMGDDMLKVVAWYDNEWGYSATRSGLSGALRGELGKIRGKRALKLERISGVCEERDRNAVAP